MTQQDGQAPSRAEYFALWKRNRAIKNSIEYS